MDKKLAIIFIIVFLLGLYFIKVTTQKDTIEPFDGDDIISDEINVITQRCPNVLIQKGASIYLYNSTKAKIPGVNPVRFNHLEDYVEFVNWQRSQGIRCPILFLQYTHDAQGKMNYRIRPSPLDPQGGLPPSLPMGSAKAPTSKLYDAGRDDSPFNKNSYPAFDPENQYVGLYTPLDKMYHENQPKNYAYSASAMDPSWGGIKYTKKIIDDGFYDKDEVAKETDAE